MSEDTTVEILSGGDAATIAELAAKAEPTQTVTLWDREGTDRRSLVVGHGPDGPILVVDLDLDQLADRPVQHSGAIEVHTPAALVAYASRHAHVEQTTLWGDLKQGSITVVLNDHGELETGWADHRAAVSLRRSPEWDAWAGIDGKLIGQVELAEFLQERRADVIEPNGSDLLDIVQTFHATTGARFKKAVVLHSGEQTLQYEETIDARAGRAGEATVPQELTVLLRPWLGVDPVDVTAAFRFRIRDGQLALGVQLRQLQEHSDAAVEEALLTVANGLDLPAILGTPPTARR